MEFYHEDHFYLVLPILSRVLVKFIEYFLLHVNMTCCCVSPFLPVIDLEKRKEPKPRVKVVDKGNGNKPTPPVEGQIFFFFFLDLLIRGLELF